MQVIRTIDIYFQLNLAEDKNLKTLIIKILYRNLEIIEAKNFSQTCNHFTFSNN